MSDNNTDDDTTGYVAENGDATQPPEDLRGANGYWLCLHCGDAVPDADPDSHTCEAGSDE